MTARKLQKSVSALSTDRWRLLSSQPVHPVDERHFVDVTGDTEASEIAVGDRRSEPTSTWIDDQFTRLREVTNERFKLFERLLPVVPILLLLYSVWTPPEASRHFNVPVKTRPSR